MGPLSVGELFSWWCLHAKPPGTSQKFRMNGKRQKVVRRAWREGGHGIWEVATKHRMQRERLASMKDFFIGKVLFMKAINGK